MASVVHAFDIVHSIWKASNRKSLLSLSPRLQELPWASASWSNNLAMLDASPHFQKTLIPAFQAWEDFVRDSESNLMREWRVWLKIEADAELPPSEPASWHNVTLAQQQCSLIMLCRIFDGACVERFGWSDKLMPRLPYTIQESSSVLAFPYLNDWAKILEDFSKIAGSIIMKSSTFIRESDDLDLDLNRITNNIETKEKKFRFVTKRLLRNIHITAFHLAHLIVHDFLSLNDGMAILPVWYRYGSTGGDERNNVLDWRFHHHLQVVALISPIFAAVSETSLEPRHKWKHLLEYSRRLGNDKPKIVQEVEVMFWKTLLRIASHEVGLGEGIKELAEALPMDAIRTQSQHERQWFMLAPTAPSKRGTKRKRTNEEDMAVEMPMTSGSNPGPSYLSFTHSGCFQHIRLQAPSWTSSQENSAPLISDSDDELSRVQCGIPVHTLAGLKTQYFFLAHESSASYLDQWLEAVISRLDRKGPCYLDPSRSAESGFIIESYRSMSDIVSMQRAMSKRNVILIDAPENGHAFDRASLSQFYPVKGKIRIFDHLNDYPPKKCSGTLGDMIEASSIDDDAVLSTERLALPEASISSPGISSDIAAWRATKGRLFCPADEAVSISHIRGAFASLKGSFRGIQIAYDGFGMVVKVECGAVWFIVGTPIKKGTGFEISDYYREGRTNINAPDWEKWAYEAVLLTSGTQLILQPNTPFATVALEHAFYTIDHFYSTCNLVQTLAGLTHMLCSPHMAKSASISSSCALLQRYTICLHAALVLHDIDESDPVSKHLPDVTTSEGASNFLAACIIAINLDIFDWSSYELRNTSPNSLDRYGYVRELAYELLDWFFFHHTLEEILPAEPRASSGFSTCKEKAANSVTIWTSDSILQANGRLIASMINATLVELASLGDGPHLNNETLNLVVNQVFPMNHERGGAVIRREYQEALGLSKKTNAERLDFVRRNWDVSTVVDPQFSSFQPQAVPSHT